jgi:hypothetical protein
VSRSEKAGLEEAVLAGTVTKSQSESSIPVFAKLEGFLLLELLQHPESGAVKKILQDIYNLRGVI